MKRQWENYLIIELQVSTKIIVKWTSIYCWQYTLIYLSISFWTILKWRLVIALGFQGGWVCFQKQKGKGEKEPGEREKRTHCTPSNMAVAQQHADQCCCVLCLTGKQTNIQYGKLQLLILIKIWNNWNRHFWERQITTFSIIHASELLAMENYFGHTNINSAHTTKKIY